LILFIYLLGISVCCRDPGGGDLLLPLLLLMSGQARVDVGDTHATRARLRGLGATKDAQLDDIRLVQAGTRVVGCGDLASACISEDVRGQGDGTRNAETGLRGISILSD
jgi:hypothetical protein